MSDPAEVRDDLLLRRLAAGEEDAFLTLYRRHQRPLYRYALHMTGRPEAAEEVVQETFMAVIRHADRFDPGRGEFRAFLFGIARNHVRRLLDSSARYHPLPDDDLDRLPGRHGAPSPSADREMTDRLAHAELGAEVRRAVLSLPVRYREVVTLCDLEEMEYGQAAAVLRCPVGTIRSRLNRAREMLAAKLRSAFAPRSPARLSSTRALDTR